MTDNQPTPEQYAKLTDLTIEALRQALVTLRKLQTAVVPTRRAWLAEELQFYLRVLEHATASVEPAQTEVVFQSKGEAS